jgi:TonB family protein
MSNQVARLCKTQAIALSVLCLSLFPATPQSFAQLPDKSVEMHLTKAHEAMQSKKYDRAEEEIKLSLKLNPDSAQAKLLLAAVYRKKERYREAFQTVFEALRIQPRFPEAHYLLAQLYYETEESGQAKKELDLAFKEGVNIAEAHALKAYMALDEDNSAAAIASFETAIALAPKNNIDEIFVWRLKMDYLKSNRECRARNKVVAQRDAQPFNTVNVRYPKEAKKNKIEGSVNICALIDEKGVVRSSDIMMRLGYGTEEEASKALKELYFFPAIKDGRPIPYWTTVEFVFKLP